MWAISKTTMKLTSFFLLGAQQSILTTMDMTTDGFGFMLAFGNLCWVPMVYCLQARYLVAHPVDLNLFQAGIITALLLGGYYIFRGSNGEKDKFRTDPHAPSVKRKFSVCVCVCVCAIILLSKGDRHPNPKTNDAKSHFLFPLSQIFNISRPQLVAVSSRAAGGDGPGTLITWAT